MRGAYGLLAALVCGASGCLHPHGGPTPGGGVGVHGQPAFAVPPRLTNAILVPSFDQDGELSWPQFVSAISLVPSILMTEMPVPTLAKMIFVPSGDHAGPESLEALIVTRRSFVPSALMIQMSPPDWNASLVPSGEYAGAAGDGCVIAVKGV